MHGHFSGTLALARGWGGGGGVMELCDTLVETWVSHFS